MSKAKRGAYRDLLRTQAGWADRMVKALNAGFAARYGPSAYAKPGDEAGPIRGSTAPIDVDGRDLHPTKGYGPPYIRRGKRSNS